MKKKIWVIGIGGVALVLLLGVLVRESRQSGRIVGIVQIAAHPALDSIREGVIDELTVQGFGSKNKIRIETQNASGQMPMARSICDKFVAEGASVIIPIATPTSQAAAGSTTKVPIVFGAVTDPINAGLVSSMEKPGKNITGVSDIWPIRQQIQLIVEFLPNTKAIGVIFNPGEANNDATMPLMRRACADMHLDLKEATISSVTEIQSAASSLIGKVDVFYNATDSIVVSGLESLVKVARDNRIPLFVGDVDSVERGGIAALGINYNRVGHLTGELAARVLRGENPGNIPVVIVKDFDLVINKSAAQKMGVTIPEAVLKRAKRIIE